MSNMDLWTRVFKTPPTETKPITGKPYSGTSPKPYYLVQKATETFGPCGIGWGFDILSERIEEGAPGEKIHIARVRVWYEWGGKRGTVEHIGQTPFSGTRKNGQPYTDEDAPKKSVTDALVKALSMIGFAGDIFIGRYDDSKYVNGLRAEAREADEPVTDRPPLTREQRDIIAEIAEQNDPATFREWWAKRVKQIPPNTFTTDEFEVVKGSAIKRARELEKGTMAA